MALRNKVTGLVLLTVLGIAAWVVVDYRSWLALGPGGVPYNFAGWAQVTRMRLGSHGPFDMSLFEREIGTARDRPLLGVLSARAGARPRVDPHPIPHRQTDQHGDAPARAALQALFDRAVAERSELLHYQKSHFENRNDAIWLREPQQGNPATRAQGEIAHIHPSDGSMHLTLSPSDAKKVIDARWGELHTLAGVNDRLPATYTMLYSPRDNDERAVIDQILRAAVSYAAGEPTLSR